MTASLCAQCHQVRIAEFVERLDAQFHLRAIDATAVMAQRRDECIECVGNYAAALNAWLSLPLAIANTSPARYS
jgi:hypothetical protein